MRTTQYPQELRIAAANRAEACAVCIPDQVTGDRDQAAMQHRLLRVCGVGWSNTVPRVPRPKNSGLVMIDPMAVSVFGFIRIRTMGYAGQKYEKSIFLMASMEYVSR